MSKLQALKSGDWLDYFKNKCPKCPHCGANFDIAENEAWELYSEGEHEIECQDCDRPFTVTVHAEYTFSTEEQPDEDEDEGSSDEQ